MLPQFELLTARYLHRQLAAGDTILSAQPGGQLMPDYPLECSCGRCYKNNASAPYQDSENLDTDSTLAYCPQCGQQLEKRPTYDERREKGHTP
jgi:hypothetical protein